uniref:Uncharacterized protein n=1 Tax=Brassica oleracea TaxID=3712 RepID=A0A3P6FEF7_BRAOL|nr:unnamed protein product [Brassica oleracea]
MFVALFHGVPTLVDESDDEEAVESNWFFGVVGARKAPVSLGLIYPSLHDILYKYKCSFCYSIIC